MIVAVPRARQASTAQTRARILLAAREMFIAYGYRSTSLRSIAVTAGVSHPGLLKHFASKEELLVEIVNSFEDDNMTAVEEIIAGSEPGVFPFVEIARRNEQTRGYLALFAALTGEASTASHPAHASRTDRYAWTIETATAAMEDAILHGVVSEDRDPQEEAIRIAAAWDGLQLIEQYLPERVSVTGMLEIHEGHLALPLGWRAPDEERPEPQPAARVALAEVFPAEEEAGYAAGRRKRAQIVADAMALFAKEGYGDTSLRDIAEHVGVSKSSLMHHYPTKESLLGAVLSERDRSISARPGYSVDMPAVDELRALPAGATENARTAPGLIEVYAVLSCEAVPPSHPAHDYFASRFTRTLDQFRALFQQAQNEGALPAHRDPEQEAIWMVALWDGLQYQWLHDRESTDIAAHLEAHLADVLPA